MILTSLVGLFMTPFILKYVTKEEYAIYYIAADILIWLSIIQLGVAPAFTSRTGHMIGAQRSGEISSLASSAWGTQIMSATLLVVIGYILSDNLEAWFPTENKISGLGTIFFIMVINAALVIVSQVFSSLMIANKQIHIDNLIKIFILVFNTGLAVFLLLKGWHLMGLALSGLVSTVLLLVINYYRVRVSLPGIRFRLLDWRWQETKQLVKQGSWFTLGGIAGILIVSMDRIIVGKFVSVELVANLIITYKLFSLSEKALSKVVDVSRPYLSQMYGRKDFTKLKGAYSFLTVFALFSASLIGVIIFIINKHFIQFWVGDGFYLGDSINLLLTMNFILQFAILPNRALLASTMYKLGPQNSVRILEGLLNLGLSIVLAHYMGVFGVILASIVATVLLSNVLMNALCEQLFRENHLSGDYKFYQSYLVVLLPLCVYTCFLLFDYYVAFAMAVLIFLGSLLVMREYLSRISCYYNIAIPSIIYRSRILVQC